MLIKFLSKGTGPATFVAEYLTGETDWSGEVRDEVKVLRGDPHQVAAVANSLTFKYKYTSGVISWAPDDNPTEKDIDDVLTEFEMTAWPGLESDRYAWSAILHRSAAGGCHVHIFAARVDLQTGKSLNIAPPSHLIRFDTLRNFFNFSKGWARPDDPERARMVQKGSKPFWDKKKILSGLKLDSEPDTKSSLHYTILRGVQEGTIQSRKDILAFLHGLGLKTPRISKNFISVQNPMPGEKNFRLKGALYTEDFKPQDFWDEIKKKQGYTPEQTEKIDKKKAAIAYRRLLEDRKRLEKYNSARYQIKEKIKNPNKIETPDKIAEMSSGKVGISDKRYKKTLALAFEQNENGAFFWKNRPYLQAFSDSGAKISYNSKNQTAIKAGIQLSVKKGWQILNVSSNDRDFCVTSYIEARKQGYTPDNITFSDYRLDEKTIKKIEETQNGINGNRRNFPENIAKFREQTERNNFNLDAANRKLEHASDRINRALQLFSPSLLQQDGERRMNNELNIFKRDIDLVAFAKSKKFVLDNKKSSEKSLIMRRGSEKIGIAINRRTGDQNFHNFLTGKGGTVIDFAQQESGKNLGEIRQELRAYMGSQKPQATTSSPRPATRPTPAERTEQEKKMLHRITASSPAVAYLASRGISAEILADPRFGTKIYTDNRGNVCFPHNSSTGFSGCEKKNHDFTGFSKGGTKGFWSSKAPEIFTEIVFCESGIDCLSHALLYPDPTAGYISLSGQISSAQEVLIKDVLRRNPDKKIVAAFDNDVAGQKYAALLQRLAGDRSVTVDVPRQKDWNDDLQSHHKATMKIS